MICADCWPVSCLFSERACFGGRYETQTERVRGLVLDAVKEYIGPRKQPIETVTRNILRLLASVCGIPEVSPRQLICWGILNIDTGIRSQAAGSGIIDLGPVCHFVEI